MTNTKLLKNKIVQSGLKIGYIAQMTNLSRSGLNKKINGKHQFNQFEMKALRRILNIKSDEEFHAIFFADDVD